MDHRKRDRQGRDKRNNRYVKDLYHKARSDLFSYQRHRDEHHSDVFRSRCRSPANSSAPNFQRSVKRPVAEVRTLKHSEKSRSKQSVPHLEKSKRCYDVTKSVKTAYKSQQDHRCIKRQLQQSEADGEESQIAPTSFKKQLNVKKSKKQLSDISGNRTLLHTSRSVITVFDPQSLDSVMTVPSSSHEQYLSTDHSSKGMHVDNIADRKHSSDHHSSFRRKDEVFELGKSNKKSSSVQVDGNANEEYSKWDCSKETDDQLGISVIKQCHETLPKSTTALFAQTSKSKSLVNKYVIGNPLVDCDVEDFGKSLSPNTEALTDHSQMFEKVKKLSSQKYVQSDYIQDGFYGSPQGGCHLGDLTVSQATKHNIDNCENEEDICYSWVGELLDQSEEQEEDAFTTNAVYHLNTGDPHDTLFARENNPSRFALKKKKVAEDVHGQRSDKRMDHHPAMVGFQQKLKHMLRKDQPLLSCHASAGSDFGSTVCGSSRVVSKEVDVLVNARNKNALANSSSANDLYSADYVKVDKASYHKAKLDSDDLEHFSRLYNIFKRQQQLEHIAEEEKFVSRRDLLDYNADSLDHSENSQQHKSAWNVQHTSLPHDTSSDHSDCTSQNRENHFLMTSDGYRQTAHSKTVDDFYENKEYAKQLDHFCGLEQLDKREVFYSKKDDLSDQEASPTVHEESVSFIPPRLVISSQACRSYFDSDVEQNSNYQQPPESFTSALDDDVDVSIIPGLDGVPISPDHADNSHDHVPEFWGFQYIKWFSQNILDTKHFQQFVEVACPPHSADNLPELSLRFLQCLANSDKYAIRCIPRNASVAKDLLVFIDKFKNMENGMQEMCEELGIEMIEDDASSKLHHEIPITKSIPRKVVDCGLHYTHADGSPTPQSLKSQMDLRNEIFSGQVQNTRKVTCTAEDTLVASISKYQSITPNPNMEQEFLMQPVPRKVVAEDAATVDELPDKQWLSKDIHLQSGVSAVHQKEQPCHACDIDKHDEQKNKSGKYSDEKGNVELKKHDQMQPGQRDQHASFTKKIEIQTPVISPIRKKTHVAHLTSHELTKKTSLGSVDAKLPSAKQPSTKKVTKLEKFSNPVSQKQSKSIINLQLSLSKRLTTISKSEKVMEDPSHVPTLTKRRNTIQAPEKIKDSTHSPTANKSLNSIPKSRQCKDFQTSHSATIAAPKVPRKSTSDDKNGENFVSESGKMQLIHKAKPEALKPLGKPLITSKNIQGCEVNSLSGVSESKHQGNTIQKIETNNKKDKMSCDASGSRKMNVLRKRKVSSEHAEEHENRDNQHDHRKKIKIATSKIQTETSITNNASRDTASNSSKLFGCRSKQVFSLRAISRECPTIPHDKEKHWEQFKKHVKNFIKERLNFLYGVWKYDYEKLKQVANDAATTFRSPVIKRGQVLSNDVALYITKECFQVCGGDNAVSKKVKKQLDERGENWWRTTLSAFKKFYRGIARECDKRLGFCTELDPSKRRKLSSIETEFEMLYPQFSRDARCMILLWCWSNLASKIIGNAKFKRNSGATTPTGDKVKKLRSWLSTVYTCPPCQAPRKTNVSVLTSPKWESMTKQQIIDVVTSWWIEGYYLARYEAFEKTETEEASKESPEDILNMDGMVVLDEDFSDTDSTSDTIDRMPVHDQDTGATEYTEDDSGAPTILLY